MAALNKVQVIGNLGRDPEMRYTANGRAVANFSVAVNRKWTDQDGQTHEDTEWVRVSCWEKTAENVAQYLGKGSLVYVEGRLQTRKYQDKEGNDRQSTEVVAQQVIFLDPPRGRDERPQTDSGGRRPNPPVAIDPDDLPFE